MSWLNSLVTRSGLAAALSFVVALTALAQDGGVSGGGLLRNRNLSDLPNKPAARINLGVTATGADPAYLKGSNNLSDVGNAATARGNLDITSATVGYTAPYAGAAAQTIAAKLGQIIDVRDFGAAGLCGISDIPCITAQTAAINAAIAAADAAGPQLGRPPAGSSGAAVPTVKFTAGVYYINNNINLGLYTHIAAENDVYLFNIDNTKDTLTGSSDNGYQVRIKGISLIGGKRQIVLSRVANLDASMNVIEDVTFASGDYTQPAVYFFTQSAHNHIIRPRVLDRPYFLQIASADKVTVEGGWINGYESLGSGKKPANTASFVTGTGTLTIKDVLFTPEMEGYGSSNANTRWIDNYGQLFITRSRFGGENGGFPTVYNYASAFTGAYPYVPNASISITDSYLSTGNSSRADRGIIVPQTALPSGIFISNVTGITESPGVNTSQMSGGSAVTWLAANADLHNPQINITVDAPQAYMQGFGVPAELQKYARYVDNGLNGSGNTYYIGGTAIPNSATLTKTSDNLSVFAATTSAQLRGVLSDETGTGAAVFATSPTIITPTLEFASTLATYAEGQTGAVTMTCGSGTITLNAGGDKWTYTRVGRQTLATGRFTVASVSSPVGLLQITGLPYASIAATGSGAAAAVRASALQATAATAMQGVLAEASSSIIIKRYAAGLEADACPDIKAGSELDVTVMYHAQ